MPEILIVDDDIGTLDIFGAVLRLAGWSVLTAPTGAEARQRISSAPDLDVLLTDLRLPDIDGIELVREVKQRECQPAVVVATAFATVPSTVEAMRLGAVDYVEKPIDEDQLLALAQRALKTRVRPPKALDTEGASRATLRWVALVRAVAESSSDVRTIDQWAQLAGVSVATLKSRCKAIGTTPKSALMLGRILRAVRLGESLQCEPEVLVDADPRTVRRLLSQLGMDSSLVSPVPSIEELLNRQQLIQSRPAVDSLRRAFERDTTRS